MTDISQLSVGELREHYTQWIKYWSDKRLEHQRQIEQCNLEIQAYEAKLRHLAALSGAAPAPPAKRRRGKKRRQRRSPVKIATLQVLRNRPGHWLNTQQIVKAIWQDTARRASRQAVNVNLGHLEREGLVRKQPAPRQSGARFVYSALLGV